MTILQRSFCTFNWIKIHFPKWVRAVFRRERALSLTTGTLFNWQQSVICVFALSSILQGLLVWRQLLGIVLARREWKPCISIKPFHNISKRQQSPIAPHQFLIGWPREDVRRGNVRPRTNILSPLSALCDVCPLHLLKLRTNLEGGINIKAVWRPFQIKDTCSLVFISGGRLILPLLSSPTALCWLLKINLSKLQLICKKVDRDVTSPGGGGGVFGLLHSWSAAQVSEDMKRTSVSPWIYANEASPKEWVF